MTSEEVTKLVEVELSMFRDAGLRKRVETHIVLPFPQERIHEWGEIDVPFTAWIVCNTTAKNVAVAYACGGFDKVGFPWGLVFKDQGSSGPPSCWYSTFEECVSDSGCFD